MSTALRQGNLLAVQKDADNAIEYVDSNEIDKEVGKSSAALANGAPGESAATREPSTTVDGEIAQPQRGSSASAEYREPHDMSGLSQSRVSGARSNASKTSLVSTDNHRSSVNNETGDSTQSEQLSDVIDRGLLSMQEASRLYARYSHELVQYFPTVVLPEGCDADDIRRTKPILFLAVIAAASGSSDADLNVTLNKEILQIYAHQIVIKGEKSLELIQSMLITIAWYCPPDNFEELRFYQYIHMAATMALDLGIGRKTREPLSYSDLSAVSSLESPGLEALQEERCHDKFRSSPPIDSGLLDSRRTLLSCYLNCSRFALSLHLQFCLTFRAVFL